MPNYVEILRLDSLNHSQRTIESTVHCSRRTVRSVLQAAKENQITWPLDNDITRRCAWLEEEKQYMLPLPAVPFEAAVWSVAKVSNDYLVSDGRNKYSVPYNLIGEKVDIRVTKTAVEVFYYGSRVTSHRRLQTIQREPQVKLEHLPLAHQKYLAYNAGDFSRWAMSIEPMTEKVVQHFLTSGTAPEQGYKACASLTKLGERYGRERLENACGRILAYSTTPSIRNISSFLKTTRTGPRKQPRRTSQTIPTASALPAEPPISGREARTDGTPGNH